MHAMPKVSAENDSVAASQCLLGKSPECLPRGCAHGQVSVTLEQGCLNKRQNFLRALLPSRQILLKVGIQSELEQYA